MEAAEDYLLVSLARLDALRRKGPSHMETLRKAFQDTNELMEVRSLSCVEVKGTIYIDALFRLIKGMRARNAYLNNLSVLLSVYPL